MTESTTFKKKKSIIWTTLAGLLLAALVVLFLLPSLVSTDWAGNKIKQVLNDQLPGTIDFETLSVSWFSGIKSSAIFYDNRQHGIVIKVAELNTAKGLLAFAVNHKELGSIDVKAPVASVYLTEKSATVGSKTDGSPAQESKIPEKTGQDAAITLQDEAAKSGGRVMLPPLTGDIVVSGGALDIVYPDSTEISLLKDLTLQTRFDGSENRLEYQLAFESGDSVGQVKGSGTIMLPAEGSSTLEEIESQAELDIEAWEIADLLSFLSHIAGGPTGSGQLNGRLSILGSAATALQIKGDLSTQQLKLQGGPLKSDTPSLERIALEIDAEQTAKTMKINRLTLTSSLATAAITGTIETPGNKDISSTAKIDLKQLFSQFPSSLNLKEGTTVSNGMVDLNVKVRAAGKDTHFDGSARLDQLQGVAGGKKLAWDTPVILEARGTQSSEGLQLDNFNVQSAFLNGTGQGDINQMEIQLAADIGEAMKEIAKFIQLDGWKSNGKLNLNLLVETKSAELRSTKAVVGITDFVLQQNDTIIAPQHSFSANMSSDLRLDQDMQPQEMLSTTVDFASWVGDGSIKLATFLPASEQTSLQFDGLDAAGNFNLKHLSTLLQGFKALPQDTMLAGLAKIEVKGSLKQSQLQLDHALIDATELLVSQGSKTAQDQQLKLTTAGTIHLGERKIALEPVDLKSSSGSIAVSGLTIADWADLTKPIRATVEADLDLTRVSSIIGTFLPEKWAGSGKLVMKLEITPEEQQAAAVAGNIEITNFSLKNGQRTLAPKGDATVSLNSRLHMDKAVTITSLRGSKLNYKTWMGAGQISLESLELKGPQNQPAIERLMYDGSIDLSALSGLLKSVGMLPEDISLAGLADIDTQLSFEADKLELDQTSVNATDFVFQKGEQTLREKKIQLTTRGSVNLQKKAAALQPFELQTTTGHITLPELELNDWSNLQNGIKTKGSIELELGELAVLLSDMLTLPDGTSVAGQTTLTIDTDLSDAKQQFVKIDGTIAPFELSLPDKKPLSEKSIQLMIDLNGNVSEQKFALNKLELSSSPVTLNASGAIKSDNKEHVLNAQGAMKLDLEAISSYLSSLSELKLEMTGASEKPFSIKATSLDGKWVEIPKRSEIATSFHADTIRGFGLLVESLEVPIKLANGVAEVDIQGTVNKGKMSLQPAIDFSAEPPVISIPENNLVLTGVGLSENMSRDLLAQLHPIFIGAAVSQGTLDLGLRHFKWPLGAAERKKAKFSGTITFNEVILRAGGLLTPLLEVMKVEERELTIGDQPMECIGENDRVRCSPLEILIKDHSLMFSGSIGFDKSLDYIARIPVTQQMVGGDAFKYLEGTSISVPIGGTVSKPSIRKDVVQTALKDLIIQAGKKQITDQAGKLLQNLFK
jgi:hypothetical protein